MIYIKLIPYGLEDDKMIDCPEIAIQADTYKQCLRDLIYAINADIIDCENNRLVIVNEE